MLYESGFNTLFMLLEPFWQKVENDPLISTFEEKRKKAVDDYYIAYLEFKKIGYTKFILGIGGWGMNEPDAWWKLASEKFRGHTDIVLYNGEFIESFYERQPPDSLIWNDNNPWTKDDVVNKLLIPRKQYDNRFLFDTCKRNYDYLNSKFPNEVSVSSYLFQSSKWHIGFPFVWIMGQPSYHLFNTWWYSILNLKCKKNKIEDVYLYQGNKPEWTWDGWEAKILDIIGIENWIEKMRRKWFIYIFKD
jgi:hypothetical protein